MRRAAFVLGVAALALGAFLLADPGLAWFAAEPWPRAL